MVDQNWIKDLLRSISYPIGPPSKLYGYNKATIKRVMADRITPQARPLNVLKEIHLRKNEILDTRSNTQLFDLDSKPRGGKSLRNLIDCAIGVQFYPPPGSLHYQKLFLGIFNKSDHINCEKKKKSEIKNTKISSSRYRTTKARADQI